MSDKPKTQKKAAQKVAPPKKIGLQEAAEAFAKAVQDHYKKNDAGDVEHVDGHFAGWSDKEIKKLADKLQENVAMYPINSTK